MAITVNLNNAQFAQFVQFAEITEKLGGNAC